MLRKVVGVRTCCELGDEVVCSVAVCLEGRLIGLVLHREYLVCVLHLVVLQRLFLHVSAGGRNGNPRHKLH